jgi:uncharacterized protein YegJ (DUF2314 family)
MRFIIRFATAGAVMCLGLAACSRDSLPPVGEDGVTFMGDEAPMMQKAMARARRELDGFLELAGSPPGHLESFAVKVGLPADDDQTEYVWINGFELQPDGKYLGVINNELELTDEYQLGDQYTFAKTEIVDWTYVDSRERKMYGNYTLCALLSQESPEEADAYMKQYKLDCEL